MSTCLKSWRTWLMIAILLAFASSTCLADTQARVDYFGDLSPKEKAMLVEMAECAKAAYPSTPIPSGYRAMTHDEWNALDAGGAGVQYCGDGYVANREGLRGRLMVHVDSGRYVVAWSGCDNFSGDDLEWAKDFLASLKHVAKGAVRSQYQQALALSCCVASASRSQGAWVVGHSLGGSIAAYIALALDECPEGVEFATFNGLGVSPSCVSGFGEERHARCSSRLVNVYSDRDPVYHFFPDDMMLVHKGDRLLTIIRRWGAEMRALPVPEHPGRSVCIKYRLVDPDDEGEDWEAKNEIVGRNMPLTYYHGITELIRQMRLQSPAKSNWFTWVSVGISVLSAVAFFSWLFIRRRKAFDVI